jgi:hypothetical protein
MSRRLLPVLVAASSFTCASDNLSSIPDKPKAPASCRTGGVTGHVCLPGGSTPLSEAYVYVQATDCNGVEQRYQSVTGEDGQFALVDVPEGTFDLVIESDALTTTIPVRVVGGQIATVTRDADGDLLCAAPPLPRVAVITSAVDDGEPWDQVDVLLDDLQIPYDLFDGGGLSSDANELLSDFTALSEYDTVFINCGYMDRDFFKASIEYEDYFDFYGTITFNYNAITYQNLRQFVQNGGSLYASDWAWPAVEGLKANVIDFYGSEGTDGNEVTQGVEGTITADVTNSALESFLGSDRVAVDFDLPIWAVINSVDPSVDVYVRGNFEVYTDDYGFNKTTLTDKPLLVGYRPFAGGGYVIYTTFHYSHQPSAQMLDVLRYLIFQL